MKKQMALILSIIGIFLLSACGNNEEVQPNEEQKETALTVFTTVYPLQYFTEQIGGEYVQVESIYPPGANEHTYEPSQKDIVKMAEADLFFYIGHHLEGFMTKAAPIFKSEGVTTMAIGETVKFETTHEESEAHEDNHNEHNHAHEEHGHSHDDHDHGDVDPHIWIDPIYSMQMAEEIKKQLVKKIPEQKEYFENQYAKLAERLQEIDEQLNVTITNAATKKLIVSHSAYGYWEKRYGLEQIAVSGLNNSDEPSQKTLQNIIETAKKNNLNYVVFEQNVSSKITEIIQKEMNAQPLQLHNLSVLTEKDIQAEADYFSLMKENIQTLKTALY